MVVPIRLAIATSLIELGFVVLALGGMAPGRYHKGRPPQAGAEFCVGAPSPV
jgi:hypothetical protein